MEKKRSFGQKVEAFFAGKGFYIVLFLCLAVIGVSAWAMLRSGASNRTIVEDTPVNDAVTNEDYEAYTVPSHRPEVNDSDSDLGLSYEPPEIAEEELSDPVIAQNEPVDEQETSVWSPSDAVTDTQQTYLWPLNGEIETPYSAAALIYSITMADWRTHDGVDISAELGTHVMSISAGRVESIYTDDLYGVTVVIDHMGGLKSIYSNLAEVPTVSVGDSVIAGDIIGAVGNTALAETGNITHLHFAMTQDGAPVDPQSYLPERS